MAGAGRFLFFKLTLNNTSSKIIKKKNYKE